MLGSSVERGTASRHHSRLLAPSQAAAHEDSPPQQRNTLGPQHNQEQGQAAAVTSHLGEEPRGYLQGHHCHNALPAGSDCEQAWQELAMALHLQQPCWGVLIIPLWIKQSPVLWSDRIFSQIKHKEQLYLLVSFLCCPL